MNIMETQHTMYKGVTYLDISQPITTKTSDREVGPNSHTNVLVKSTRTKNPVYTTENLVEGKALMQNLVYQTITGKSVKKIQKLCELPLCLQCSTVYPYIMHHLIY